MALSELDHVACSDDADDDARSRDGYADDAGVNTRSRDADYDYDDEENIVNNWFRDSSLYVKCMVYTWLCCTCHSRY